VLRQAGLVNSDRRGSFVHYTLSSAGLAQVREALQAALSGEQPSP
jgi:hypothetical protein